MIELHEIELAVQARLKLYNLDIKEFDISNFPANTRSLAVNIALNSGGNFKRITNNTMSGDLNLRLLVVGSDYTTEDETSRRAKSLPIIKSIIDILFLQNLDLDIRPFKLKSFNYRTAPKSYQEGFIIWEIILTTSTEFTKVETEVYPDLNQVWIEHFLQNTIPSELETLDAEDYIELNQEE